MSGIYYGDTGGKINVAFAFDIPDFCIACLFCVHRENISHTAGEHLVLSFCQFEFVIAETILPFLLIADGYRDHHGDAASDE